MSLSEEELLVQGKAVFGPKFGGHFSDAPAVSIPDISIVVDDPTNPHTFGALLAVSGHQKGHFEKTETMDAVRNATEVHDLLAIEGSQSITGHRVIRCENLTLQDGATLTIEGGVSEGIDPTKNLVIVAAKKLLVRTPTSGAGVTILAGEKEPKPTKPAKAKDGANGSGVGADGEHGQLGKNGASSVPDQPRIMRQVVLCFDDIEVTAPNDPTATYPALTFVSDGRDGRDGGDGGDGGHGGNGTQGSSSVTKAHILVDLHCAAGPGPGGDGGDGGRAGHGGSAEDGVQGANLILMSTRTGIQKMIGFEFHARPGSPGVGGNPGRPGNLGWHGAEGNVNWPCTHAGRDGTKGLTGARGRPGANGADNEHRGRIYYSILSQGEFDSLWP